MTITVRILNAPEVHPEGDHFFLNVDANVYDDGVEVPGFHKTIKIPIANMAQLVAMPDLQTAFAYIAEQIGLVDPAYSQARLEEAVTALRINQTLIARITGGGLTWPIDVPVGDAPETVASLDRSAWK